MKYYLVAVLLSSTLIAQSNFFTVEDLFIEGKFFTGHSNDFIAQAIDRKLDKGLNLGLNLNMLGDIGYFHNYVVSTTTCLNGEHCAFTSIAYNFTVGIRFLPGLDLEYGHTSSHALDHNFAFPTQDFIGFRLNLIKHDNYGSLIP